MENVSVDIQVLGIGGNGHIGFNEPGTPFTEETHIVDLTEKTRSDNARFFENDINKVPTQAITMGIATIMKAKKILLVASGANKADAVAAMVNGPVDPACPASVLQNHPDVVVIDVYKRQICQCIRKCNILIVMRSMQIRERMYVSIVCSQCYYRHGMHYVND